MAAGKGAATDDGQTLQQLSTAAGNDAATGVVQQDGDVPDDAAASANVPTEVIAAASHQAALPPIQEGVATTMDAALARQGQPTRNN